MTKRGNLSLPQLAERYHIRSIFGGGIAYYSSSEGSERDLRAVSNSICCHEFHLIHQGTASVNMGGEDIALHRGDLLLLHPFQPVDCHFPPRSGERRTAARRRGVPTAAPTRRQRCLHTELGKTGSLSVPS